MRISVIVPVYNESNLLSELNSRLAALDVFEIFVVDGGSSDGTWERLPRTDSSSLRVQRTARGRARQMNAGAARATGDVLLFLHADTRLPDRAPELIAEGLSGAPDRRWGRFDVRFDRAGPVLKLAARAMNLRSAWTSICTGDQALFVHREDFLRIGGFAPLAIMEDIDLSRRLKQRSRPVRIREPAITSSRRWLTRGVWRTIGLMWRLRWLYWRGVPTSVLEARYYGEPK